MKFLIAAIIILGQTWAMAGTNQKGTTTDNETCSLLTDIENNVVVFESEGTGFEFNVKGEEIKAALAAGQTSFTFDGVDGGTEAQLMINFDNKGKVISANYFQKGRIFSSKIFCRHLR